MYSTSQPVELTDEEREELTARWRARSLPASDAARARQILLVADSPSRSGLVAGRTQARSPRALRVFQ